MARLIGDFTRMHSAGLDRSEYFMMDLRIRNDGKTDLWSDDVRTSRQFLHPLGETHRMKWEEKFTGRCSESPPE